MLLLPDLINFAKTYASQQPNIETAIVVSGDSEVSKLILNIANSGDHCTLIAVIPTHDPDIKDEDTRQFRNNLMFFIVKKTDTTGGNDLRLHNFSICQVEIKKLANYFLNLIDEEAEDCIFKDVDYNTMPITPVSNYFGQNGYLLELVTKTSL